MTPLSPTRTYDAIIVGGRAAGAATGLVLARAGAKVLILDRSTHGSDTTSTHALMRAGVLQLSRWGLLPEIVRAGTPPVRRTTFQIGGERTPITIKPSYGVDALYAPRRTVLDAILVDAAAGAGADVRHGVSVGGLQRDASGRVVGVTATDEHGRDLSARARITVGADGRTSNVARWVDAPVMRRGDAAGAAAYAYWSDVEDAGYEWFFRAGVSAGAIPTNGGQSCIFVGTSRDRFRRELVADPASGYLGLLAEAAPELFARLRGVRPPRRIVRFPGAAGHLRQAWGRGWALVGDAGYFKDPITAHGITDALRDAELLARAILAAQAGVEEETALAGYQATRDHLSDALFTVTDAIASYSWSLDEIGALLLRSSSAMVDEVETLAALDGAPVLAAAG
jgi:2-polyprenyl-6-methoxyphenol hydroxylase-like FAD-dependent oxidoreductase